MNEIEFLRYLIEGIVTDKNSIEIEKKDDEMGTLLTLKVAKEDMWVIIGKWGNTINALRTVLRVFGSKMDKRLNLKVLD